MGIKDISSPEQREARRKAQRERLAQENKLIEQARAVVKEQGFSIDSVSTMAEKVQDQDGHEITVIRVPTQWAGFTVIAQPERRLFC